MRLAPFSVVRSRNAMHLSNYSTPYASPVASPGFGARIEGYTVVVFISVVVIRPNSTIQ